MTMREAWRDGEARAWALAQGRLALSMAPARVVDADARDAMETTWSELLAREPAMFDGPTLAIERWAPEAAELVCRRSSYKPFAAGLAGAPVEDWLVAVTGLVTTIGEDGRERVFMGRRGVGTWLYVGMWEIGPSGVVCPPEDGGLIDVDLFRSQLREEMLEEAGLVADVSRAVPVAISTDPKTRSMDVVLAVRVPVDRALGAAHDGGEYSETRWVEWGALERFCRDAPGGVIGPALATLRALGRIG
jgi:hypothetical protein